MKALLCVGFVLGFLLALSGLFLLICYSADSSLPEHMQSKTWKQFINRIKGM